MFEPRKRGRPKVDARLDDWSEVQDKRSRKRIQDRLAQRTRRDRLLSRISETTSSDNVEISTQDEGVEQDAIALWHAVFTPTKNLGVPSSFSEVSPMASSDTSTLSRHNDQLLSPGDLPLEHAPVGQNLVYQMGQDHYLLSLQLWPIFWALKEHGLMQGIVPENCHDEVRSPIQSLTLPETLRPTPLQLLTSHRRWIDRFPFPRLRDNLIVLKDFIDLNEFIRDLFRTAGLIYRPESRLTTWDPRSWKLEPEFSHKWGYLFN